MCCISLCASALSAELNAAQQPNGVTDGAPDSGAGKGSRQVKGANLILKQFHALLVKRFHHAVRSQKDFVAQVHAHSQENLTPDRIMTSNYHIKSMAALSDRPSCQFCPHSSDLHHDRPAVRRVSQPDSDALDVRSAVHLLQVRHRHEPSQGSTVHHLSRSLCVVSSPFSNERPFDPMMKHFAECLLNRPGLGTRCMEGGPLE